LILAESESDVQSILTKYGYWDNDDDWQQYGNIENNDSMFINQQGSADSALAEKIMNSIDAVLMKECLERKIKPDGPSAPQTVRKAVEAFFNVPGGNINQLTRNKDRLKLAENIYLTATGTNYNPCLTITDLGEGQYPSQFPNTFLSLLKSNRIRIPFVQGTYNMGSTGALTFCGEQNIQLILSKKKY
jgi:hypothetical protein